MGVENFLLRLESKNNFLNLYLSNDVVRSKWKLARHNFRNSRTFCKKWSCWSEIRRIEILNSVIAGVRTFRKLPEMPSQTMSYLGQFWQHDQTSQFSMQCLIVEVTPWFTEIWWVRMGLWDPSLTLDPNSGWGQATQNTITSRTLATRRERDRQQLRRELSICLAPWIGQRPSDENSQHARPAWTGSSSNVPRQDCLRTQKSPGAMW